jgi:hypothetical protein
MKIIWTARELEQYSKSHPYKEIPVAIIGADPSSENTINEIVSCDGTIRKMIIWFPPGSAGLLSVAVFASGKGLITDLVGDNMWHSFLEAHDIKKGHFVRVILKNSDVSYGHRVGIRVELDECLKQARETCGQ